MRESNPHKRLQRPPHYHYANPQCYLVKSCSFFDFNNSIFFLILSLLIGSCSFFHFAVREEYSFLYFCTEDVSEASATEQVNIIKIKVFIKNGASSGNRTRMASLEDWNSTIELCLLFLFLFCLFIFVFFH